MNNLPSRVRVVGLPFNVEYDSAEPGIEFYHRRDPRRPGRPDRPTKLGRQEENAAAELFNYELNSEGVKDLLALGVMEPVCPTVDELNYALKAKSAMKLALRLNENPDLAQKVYDILLSL